MLRSGTLTIGEQMLLPPGVQEYYDAGDLFVAMHGEVAYWVLERFGSWYMGGVVEEELIDTVLTTWAQFFPPYDPQWA